MLHVLYADTTLPAEEPSSLRRAAWRFLAAARPLTRAAWASEAARYRAFRAFVLWLSGFAAPKTPHGLFWVDRMPYEGPLIMLRDRVSLGRLDPILVVHFENTAVAREERGVRFARRALADFAAVARWLTCAPEVRAVRIRTVLDLARFGFEERPVREEAVPSIHSWFEQLFAEGFIILHHPRGARELHERYHPLKDYWLSREAFRRKFAPQKAPRKR